MCIAFCAAAGIPLYDCSIMSAASGCGPALFNPLHGGSAEAAPAQGSSCVSVQLCQNSTHCQASPALMQQPCALQRAMCFDWLATAACSLVDPTPAYSRHPHRPMLCAYYRASCQLYKSTY